MMADEFEGRTAEGEDAWEQPVPFGPSDLPPFPVEVLPAWLRDYCRGLATALQVPVDLTAMLALAVCSACVAGRVMVEPKPGWHEPLNLWIVVPLPPGSGKSQTVREVTRPLVEWQREKNDQMRDTIAEAAARVKIAQQAAELSHKQAARAQADHERIAAEADAMRAAREVAALRIPAAPRLLANDITAERLVGVMAEQKGRLAIITPEGDIFDLMGGRYSNNIPNIGHYLAAHSGDLIMVDRTGRPNEVVENPALTLGISPQPSVVEGLQSKPEFRGRGLLGRFFYSMPVVLFGQRDTEPPPLDADDAATYARHVRALLDMQAGQEDETRFIAQTLRFDSEAMLRFAQFRRMLEPRLAPYEDLGGIVDWASKLGGGVARLAGVLHLAAYSCADGGGLDQPVDGVTVAAAVRIAHYLTPHAKAAFGAMGADERHAGALRIVGWIKAKHMETFTRTDVTRAIRGLGNADNMTRCLTLLEEYSYIRPLIIPREGGHGGTATTRYSVNPALRDGKGAR